MKSLTSLGAALLAASTLSNTAIANSCNQVDAALFQDFEATLLSAQAAGIAANAAAAPYASAAMGTQAFNESSMGGLVARWNTLRDTYQLTTTPTLPYAQLMPTFVVYFGYELNWNIAHVRYWADIHRWYNRASSPHTNAIAPAQQALDAVKLLHSKAETINQVASNCMATHAW